MRGICKEFLVTKCRWLANGGLILVTILILAGFSYAFLYDFLWHRTEAVLLTDWNMAYRLHLIGACYLTSLLLTLMALFMTYWVGPGFASDHFKSVKMEAIDFAAACNTSMSQRSQDVLDNR